MRALKFFSCLIALSFSFATLSHAQPSAYHILPDAIKTDMQKCDIDIAEFNRLMALSQKDFDQDFYGGWRAVDYKDGCSNAAAEIIKAYMLYSVPHAPQSLGILRWHAGQSKAGAGKTSEAIALFAGTYKSDAKHQSAWNLYVDATIAFLQQDKAALQRAHDTLAAMPLSEDEKAGRRKFLADNPEITMPPGFIDEPQNLPVVRGFLNCFDRSYSDAYRGCNSK